jgi:hypothetical protein
MNMYEYLESKFRVESERTLSEKLGRLASLRADLESQPAPTAIIATLSAAPTPGSDTQVGYQDGKITHTGIAKTNKPHSRPPTTSDIVEESFFTNYRNICKANKTKPNNMSITTAIMTVMNASGNWLTQRELLVLLGEEKVTKTTPTSGNVSNALNELFRKGEIKKTPATNGSNGNAFKYHSNVR